jgi:hypothetical protein
MTAQQDFAFYESISTNEDPLSEEKTGIVATQASRPAKRSRKALALRATVKQTQMVSLVKAYMIEFASFCRGRKQKPKQMIPKKVWEKIYHDYYKVKFPNSSLEKDTLKKHFTEKLDEIETGTADDENTLVLQDEKIAI